MAVHTVVESQPAGTDTGYTPRRSRQVSGEKLTHTLFYAEETNENLVPSLSTCGRRSIGADQLIQGM